MKLNCVFYPLLAGILCAILLSCGKEKTADEEFSSTFKVEKRLLASMAVRSISTTAFPDRGRGMLPMSALIRTGLRSG